VVYDAAHAFNIRYKDENILNYGDISTLSFHATKLFHTIEGGALIINDDHEDSKFNLGNMYLELRQYDKAKQCWREISQSNPSSARSHMQLGRLYLSYERPETFNIVMAKEELLKTYEINKVITGPLMLLGHVALMQGENDIAQDYFQSVTGSDIKNVEAYFLLGFLYWKKGDVVKTNEMFSKAVSYSVPEKAIAGTLSEGDTKDGISYLRPLNESIFHEYYKDLAEMENTSKQMNKIYQRLDMSINQIKKISKSKLN
jgi:tetratricopeptide (TPR) repeat protein